MRFATLATEERSLGNEAAADAASPSAASLGKEAVECRTPSGLYFMWRLNAFRNIPLKAVLSLANPASRSAELRRL